MAERIEVRKECAQKAGLGFDVAPIAPKIEVLRSPEKAA
jgi:hypothetical protein